MPPQVLRDALALAWGVAGDSSCSAEAVPGANGGGSGSSGGGGGGGGRPKAFSPLVLDEGAVVSLPLLSPPGGAGDRNPGPASALIDFVVGFAGGGFPSIPGSGVDGDITPDDNGGGGGDGGGGGGGGGGEGPLLYAVLGSGRDAETVAAEAMIGADIAVSSPASAATAAAAGFDRGGKREAGRAGVDGALGGVEEQVSQIPR